MSDIWSKDPSGVEDFDFDFAPLENGKGSTNYLNRSSSPVESVSSYVITADAGVTVDADSNTTTKVIVRISGGTAGESYNVTCRMTTTLGRVKEVSAILFITNE